MLPDLESLRCFVQAATHASFRLHEEECAFVGARSLLAERLLYYVEDDIRRGRRRRVLAGTKLPSDWFRLVWRKGALRGDELRALGAELSRLPLR